MAPVDRGIAVAIFAATTLLGPEAGAIFGSMIVQSSLGWRWTAWISLILAAVFSGIGFFLLPETYMPVLEQRHAKKLRRETKQWALHSKMDETPVSFKDFTTRYMTRPFVMLSVEPILALMTIYISFVFGLVYLLFVVSCQSWRTS
jgi:MFS family permease